jgi:SAM-dependent methyltransferase
MRIVRISRGIFLALILILPLSNFPAAAQPAKQDYEPQVGQEGKDVVWVPTPDSLVNKMLDMAKVTAKDYVIDLGSGDGRTVIAAAKRGARAHGIEYNPEMVELAARNAAKEGVSQRATFAKADLFESDFSKATVLTLFLLPEINMKLRPKILNLRPGTRVVSNSFDMEDWKPDQTATVSENCTSWCEAYLWIVPAKVQGTWKLAAGELSLKQSFQTVHGTLKTAGGVTKISNGKLNGQEITFHAGRTRYSGRVSGSEIQGTTASGANWKATRMGK